MMMADGQFYHNVPPQGGFAPGGRKARWGDPLPEGRHRGVGVAESFHTYVAQIAEISVDKNGAPKVHRVVCAVDCGIAVNPDQVHAQMEGGIGFGLGAILKSQITLDKGKVVQGNFDDYEVLRLNEMPKVEVNVVKSAELPTGGVRAGRAADRPPLPTPFSARPADASASCRSTIRRTREAPGNLSFREKGARSAG